MSDEAARQRVRAELDTTLFVEAGAGSGKTSALVGRIVELVVTGRAEMSRVAAITFTEAAAAELRDRVREALELVASGRPDPTLDPDHASRAEPERDQRARLAAQATEDLDGAALSTLHAFAGRLLREHPLAAGLPPGFEVQDAMASTVRRDARWHDAASALAEDPATQAPLLRLITMGLRLENLKLVADQCSDNWDLLWDSPPVPPPGPPPAVDASEVIGPLAEALALRARCSDESDKMLDHLEQIEESLEALRAHGADAELELLARLANVPKFSKRLGQKGNWDGCLEQVRELLTQAETAREAIVQRIAADALARITAALAQQALAQADERRRLGQLEFHDLLVLARNLLRADPAVAGELRQRYTHLLIDEFQDTDPIQAELAVRLAAPGGDGHWLSLAPEAGRLFFVGDPKQAIYRFRRADLDLFHTVREEVVGSSAALTRNFRSVPGIIAWVNAVFGELLAEAYSPLEAHRPNSAGPVPVGAIGGPVEGDMAEVRAREGADICSVIAQMTGDAPWSVGDGDRARGLHLSDIAILLPTRTGLPALQRALDDHRIPYRVEATSLVYQTREVLEVLTTMRAVDDPSDEIATVAALRSSLFGCGDDELLAWREGGGSWRHTAPVPEGLEDSPVAEAMATIAELHERRWWSDPSELIEELLRRRKVLELSLDNPRPRDTWRRLRFVVDQARAFAENAGGDLRSWLAWTDVLRDEGTRLPDAVLPETDDDAVRVLTVHAAKGLEFPAVILAGLNSGRPSWSTGLLWHNGRPEAKVGKLRTPGHEQAQKADEEAATAEALRLLYVAATRARDHLVVCYHRKETGRDHVPAAVLAEAQARCEDLWRTLDGADQKHSPARPDQLELIPSLGSDRPDARQEWLDERSDLLLAASSPHFVAPSRLAKLASEPQRDGDAPADDEEPTGTSTGERSPTRRGRGGTAFGRAVHAVLAEADLATGEGIEQLAVAHAAAEGIAARADEVAVRARSALGASSVRAAADGAAHWREMYLGTPVGGKVLEGFVDLLVSDPGDESFTVIDYKTDSVTDEAEVNSATETYRLQAAGYALAVQLTTGRPVSRCVLVFLTPGGPIEREIPDLATATAEAKELLNTTLA